jgi:hypothetical protein
MPDMRKMLASLRHAFAIPRRDVQLTRSNNLVQWSQWNPACSIASGHAITDETPRRVVADRPIVDHATLEAIDSFIEGLPARARSQLAAHALSYVRSSLHFAASVLVVLTAIALAVFFLTALGSVGFGAATWLGALAGYGANLVLIRTWRRHLIREYLRCMPPDWVLTPCPVCQYDQRGIPSHHCPECGCPVRVRRSGSPLIAARETADGSIT